MVKNKKWHCWICEKAKMALPHKLPVAFEDFVMEYGKDKAKLHLALMALAEFIVGEEELERAYNGRPQKDDPRHFALDILRKASPRK